MSGFRAALPGEYQERVTPIHRAPVLVKIAAVLLVVAAGALTRRFDLLGALALLALLAAGLARMPVATLRALGISLAGFGVVSLAATMLLGGEGGAWLPRSAEAVLARIAATGRAVLRASSALLALAAFTLTTPPEAVVDALARLRPGRRRAPGGMLLAIMIALRLVPLLGEEYLRLRRARAARGAFAGAGSRRRRLGDLRDLHVAYMSALFRRVDEMSLALEARGYRSSCRSFD